MKLKYNVKLIKFDFYIFVLTSLYLSFYSFQVSSKLNLKTSSTSGGKTSIFGSFKAFSALKEATKKSSNNNAYNLSKKKYLKKDKKDYPSLSNKNNINKPFAIDENKGYTLRDLNFDSTKSKQIYNSDDSSDNYQKKLDERENQLNLDLDVNPVKFQGWVKFFKYSSNVKNSSSKAFFVNPEFNEEQKLEKNRNEIYWTDNLGRNIHIPDKSSFYSTIYDDKLVISKSRDKFINSKYDVLRFDYLSPIADHEGYAGGIVDFGNFKEGYCFKLITNQGGIFTWIVCTSTSVEKLMMMRIIKQLKIKTQRTHYTSQSELSESLVDMKTKEESRILKNKMDTSYLGGVNPYNSTDIGQEGVVKLDNDNDGYWVVLQNWSTCTKACGTGTQTLHRMCVPPKEGGRACEGPPILTRNCNISPCSDRIDYFQANSTNRTEIGEPHLHVMPFSNRPQRYDKCILKESDLLMTIDLDYKTMNYEGVSTSTEQLSNKIQVPVRLVMNNETITAYSGLEESDLKATFNLQNSIFQTSIERDYCFIIKEISMDRSIHDTTAERGYVFKNEFCPFSGSDSGQIKNEWDYDFNLFKYQCHKQRDIEPFDVEEIHNELEREKAKMRLDIINKKKLNLKLSMPQDETELEKAKLNSLEAIKKENKIEKLIEQELKEAQKEALEKKAEELTKEQCKMDALEKAIKHKDIENQFNVRKKQKDDAIKKLKNDVREEILVKRNKLKEKLNRLKELSTKQLSNMDGQIQNIRLEIAGEIEKSNEYNSNLCKIISEKAPDEFNKEVKSYCNKKFITDYDNHKECLEIKEPNDFKKFCCDFETPLDKPEEYENCVESDVNIVKDPVPLNTRFFWHSKNYLNNFVKPSSIKKAVDFKNSIDSKFLNK